jgi:hypothetical protein
MSRRHRHLLIGLLAALAGVFSLTEEATAQAQPAAPQQPAASTQAAAPAQFMSQSLGVAAFPAKGQSAD